MLDKTQIVDYDIKHKLLTENGWVEFYHVDNWISPKTWNDPKANRDRAGQSMDSAYECALQHIEHKQLGLLPGQKKII